MQFFRRDKKREETRQALLRIRSFPDLEREAAEARQEQATETLPASVNPEADDLGVPIAPPQDEEAAPADDDRLYGNQDGKNFVSENRQTDSVPSASDWIERRREPMSTVPRENLPYPDLPVQGRTGSTDSYGAPSGATVIDRQAHFTGNYRSDADLRVEGTFEGEIDCSGTVTVAEDANLSATVRARNVVIAGNASGEIICEEKLTLKASGELRGKAQAATLVVEEGAFFEGEFKMGSSGFGSLSSSFSGWESSSYSSEPATEPGGSGQSAFAPETDATSEAAE